MGPLLVLQPGFFNTSLFFLEEKKTSQKRQVIFPPNHMAAGMEASRKPQGIRRHMLRSQVLTTVVV